MSFEDTTERPSVMARRAVAEVIKLQRRVFERQRKLIESRETHQTRGFARYRNEYRRATAGYISESGWGALCDAVADARVAYVADYHTLRLAQKTFVKLVHSVMDQVDNICLAVEFVHSRNQRDLDRYLEGAIRERTFLSRIRYREQWPYDIWPNFKPIFDLAAEQGFPVLAIDDDPDLPLIERDRRAATLIARAAVDCPDSTILVYGGQMHMAPAHLPAKVDLSFIKAGLSAPERVVVYQNAEEIYWQLAREGRDGAEVVRVSDDSYCVNNTPPLVQQLSYLHWIQFDEELLEYTELELTARSLIRNLARYLRLDIGKAAEEVRVLMPGDLDLADAIDGGELDEREQRQILLHAEAEESICIPSLGLIYLATLSVNHTAEEAAHYLKHIVSRAEPPDDLRDLFYFRVMNEACAFFGSKVVNPKRKADHQGRLRSIVARARRRKTALDVDLKAAALALEHLAWQRGERRTKLKTGRYLEQPNVFNAAAHLLGYALGDRLYYGLTDGAIAKKTIRQLFVSPLDGEGEALTAYFELSDELTQVKIPRRI